MRASSEFAEREAWANTSRGNLNALRPSVRRREVSKTFIVWFFIGAALASVAGGYVGHLSFVYMRSRGWV